MSTADSINAAQGALNYGTYNKTPQRRPGSSSEPLVNTGAGSSVGSKPKKPSSSSTTVQDSRPREMLLAEQYQQGTLTLQYETTLDYNLGWNTRAHMRRTLVPGMAVRFRIPAYSAGVIVGLTRAPAPVGYSDVEFGVIQQRPTTGVTTTPDPLSDGTLGTARLRMIVGGSAYVPIEPDVSGDVALVWGGLDNDGWLADMFPAGAIPASFHEFRVYPDRLEYWAYGDATSGEGMLLYSVPATPDTWTLTTALYSGGDKVWGIEVIEGFWPIQIPAVKVFASEASDLTVADATLPALRASGEDYIEANNADVTLPAISARGGDDVTWGDIVLPGITSASRFADDVPLIDLTFGFPEIPGIRMESTAVDYSFADVDMALPAVRVFASEVADITLGRVVVPGPIRAWGNDIVDLRRVEVVEFAYLVHVVMGFDVVYLLWSERAGLIGLYTEAEIEDAMIASQATAADALSANEILRALLAATMSASDVTSLVSDGLEVWALHMDVMGSTRYESFNFNSFATINGVTYGAGDGGIYQLDGDDDDGVGIEARVDFGSLSFGTNQRKSIPYVYVGMASTGKTYLKIESDGKTYVYEARDSTELMKAHRFEPGRGLRGSFYGFTLVSTGPSFDLHNIEFFPVPLQRRL